MKKKSFTSFIIPLIIVTAISFLGIYAQVMIDIDYKLFDAALNIKPLLEENGKYLQIEVDDGTLDKLNMYPLKRSTVADGVLVLRELGASYVLLDTQMVDPTPPGINLAKMENIEGTINQTKNNSLGLASQLIRAYASGQLGQNEYALEESEEYINDLGEQYDELFENLHDETKQIALDYDEYIAKVFSFANNVYSTNDFEEEYIIGFEKNISPEFHKYLEETQSIKNITLYHDPFHRKEENNPTIQPIMESTLGSGFVATVLDSDGATRKTDLLYNKDGYYYPQLSFKYYLDRVGKPDIEVYKNKIILKGIKKDGMEPYDLKIPITDKGELVIYWAGKEYQETFTHANFYLLYEYDELLRVINQILTKILNNPNTNAYAVDIGYQNVIQLYNMAEDIKKVGNKENIDDYIKYRELFIENSGKLLNGTDEYPSLDRLYKDLVEGFVKNQKFSQEESKPYYDLTAVITKIFEDGRVTYENLVSKKEYLKNVVKDATVTLGYTATSTFDFGSNPFEENFYNMGIYATIANNLFSEKFITILPMWTSIIIAFVLAFLSSLIIKRNEAVNSILLGFGLFVTVIALYLFTFIFTGYYINFLVPLLSFAVVFIQKISSKLLSTSKDRTFIKNAFGQYLSEDVIKDIINDPSKLKLGGEEKEITAFFTDVKGFSTISENLTPDELVTLLNEYLSAMSDIALEHKGTIDKYEGDAIIGFFGAPAPLPDHATKAVLTAIRMKEKEDKLNVVFQEKNMTPTPLHTRIGINSGPCVVGNMGTAKKMDYTMMGSDVNIAARLEGVNKQYGTWILASERTMSKTEDIFLARRLDRVRVVGINNPIRLYNPLAVRSEASEELINMVNAFEEALTIFEKREWIKAREAFKKVLLISPDDKPSIRYIQLCEKFIEKEPELNWDGVFNLTSK